MKVKRLVTLLGLALFSPATSAYANMAIPFGWYVGTNQGYSRAYDKYYPGGTTQRSGYGFSVDGGYRINLYWAVEGGYAHYAPATVKNSRGAQAASDSFYSIDIAGKLILPIGDTGAEVFGKVGAARVRSNLSVNAVNAAVDHLSYAQGTTFAIGVYAAAGVEYSITPHIMTNVQWARAQGNHNTGNLNLMTLGLAYVF